MGVKEREREAEPENHTHIQRDPERDKGGCRRRVATTRMASPGRQREGLPKGVSLENQLLTVRRRKSMSHNMFS